MQALYEPVCKDYHDALGFIFQPSIISLHMAGHTVCVNVTSRNVSDPPIYEYN